MKPIIAFVAIIVLAVLSVFVPPPEGARGQTVPPLVFAPLVADGRPVPCQCYADLYNCSDFTNRQEAQICFTHCVAWTGLDIHRLDANNDGVACESLPAGWAVWRPQNDREQPRQ